MMLHRHYEMLDAEPLPGKADEKETVEAVESVENTEPEEETADDEDVPVRRGRKRKIEE